MFLSGRWEKVIDKVADFMSSARIPEGHHSPQ